MNLKHLFKQVVVFVVAWYLLYFMTFGLHEQFHALVLHLLGIESKVTFVWVGPVPIAAFTWPEVWPVARLALALVGYPLVKVLAGRGREVSKTLYVVSAMLLAYLLLIRSRLG